LNAFFDRYPGLEELLEEFEHLTLAREDDDRAAIAYFKRQRSLREQSGVIDLKKEFHLKLEKDTRDNEEKPFEV
jgi:hypothetical protein